MPKQKKKKKLFLKKNVAALYTEGIGREGVKKVRVMGDAATIATPASFQLPLTDDEEERRRRRMARFDCSEEKPKRPPQSYDPEESLSFGLLSSRGHSFEAPSNSSRVVGRSTSLEKPYLRLTTFPKSEEVRPEEVLKKSLAHIKCQFIRTEDFAWANEQLKSIRQDLTVQGLRNMFVLEVYETHARILLEQGDLNEFHQCQTMIRNLTSRSGVMDNGNDSEAHARNHEEMQQTHEAADEFHGYGVLYNLVQNSWSDLTWSVALGNDSARLSSKDGNSMHLHGMSFRHALQVVKAILHSDYQSFFLLYESAPHLSAYLMDFLVNRVRAGAYQRIIAAYRPALSVEHIRETLYFDTLDETRRFLTDKGAVFMNEAQVPPFWLDCKASFGVT